DHGKGEHDYPAWQKAWGALFKLAEGVEVVTAWEWPAADEFQKADVLVFYQHGDWTAKRAADIDAYLDRGGGLVYVHWAADGRDDAPGFAKRIGLASRGGKIKYRPGPRHLAFTAPAGHPVAPNLPRLELVGRASLGPRACMTTKLVQSTRLHSLSARDSHNCQAAAPSAGSM